MVRLIAGLLFWAGLASAQSWSHERYDNGHTLHAYALSGQGLSLHCTGPSKGGLDVMTAEAHEDTRTARGTLMIEIGPERIPVGNAIQRSDVVIWAGGTGYRLPPVIFNELDGVWQTTLPVGDALYQALLQAPDFALAPGQDQAWGYRTTDFIAAFEETVTLCEAAWTGQGPAFQVAEGDLMRAARLDVGQGCNSTFTAGEGAFLTGLIDADETPDVVVNWAEIQCQNSFPRPFCGASHCSAKVFLSSQAGQRPDDFLAQAIRLQPLSNGRMGLAIIGRFDSCGPNSLGCERIWFWQGGQLSELR